METNNIPVRQNEEAQLKLLRARQWTYTVAKVLLVTQLLLTLAVPVAVAVLTLVKPALRPYAAAVSLAVVFVDILLLDRNLKVRLKRAARISEQFDCNVLEMPWEKFTVGEKIEPEDVHAAARAYSIFHKDLCLINWYPEIVGSLPLHLGRLICQRTNLQYDSQLRRSYGAVIKIIAFLLIVGLSIVAFTQNLPPTEWVLTVVPAAPILVWAVREYQRQNDTATHLEGLRKESNKFLDDVLAGEAEPEATSSRSRQLQNAIYLHRASSALILPFIYWFSRPQLEEQMNEGAAELVRRMKDV